MRIVTVLQTRALHALHHGSSEFTPKHVHALACQVLRWAPPGTTFECLSDVDVPGVKCTRLEHDWPGWYSKMNMFSPTMKGDFLSSLILMDQGNDRVRRAGAPPVRSSSESP